MRSPGRAQGHPRARRVRERGTACLVGPSRERFGARSNRKISKLKSRPRAATRANSRCSRAPGCARSAGCWSAARSSSSTTAFRRASISTRSARWARSPATTATACTATRSTCRACRTSPRTSISARSRAPPTTAGLEVLGYASQAQFLVNCGITDLLAAGESRRREALPARRSRGAEAAFARPRWANCSRCWRSGSGVEATAAGILRGDRSGSALASLPPVDSFFSRRAQSRQAAGKTVPTGRCSSASSRPASSRRCCPSRARRARSSRCATACSATTSPTRRCTTRARWPAVVARMVPRMEGKGNMGKLMAEMMAGVESPAPGGYPSHRRLPAQARAARARPEKDT